MCGAVIKPPVVRPGDTVGFISPASPPAYIYNPSAYKQHVHQTMASLGLHVKFGAHAFSEYGYLAGTDQERAEDVMAMFRDPSIKMIIANRGGWGCNRIIDMLNYTEIAQNPKPVLGYSDLTGLINAIATKTGMVTFHGPMGIDNWEGAHHLNSFFMKSVVMDAKQQLFVNGDGVKTRTITPGKARGKLIGGNASVFAAMIGSAYLPASRLDNAILFLEDVDEAPYTIDRMMTQMHLADFFPRITGFVFGRCTNCSPGQKNESLSLEQVLDEKIKPLGVPAFSGAMIGHDLLSQYTLPIGIQVEIDATAGSIQMLESAVTKTIFEDDTQA